MKKPPHVIEIFLQPGEWYFSGADTRIRTVLGSCVSLTLWHQRTKMGGMCHYMLPSRGNKTPGPLDGRYADEAVEILLREARSAGIKKEECEFKMFGGGNMFPGVRTLTAKMQVPTRNVIAMHRLGKHHGLRISAVDVGGSGHRHIMFDIWSGDVWVRHHGDRDSEATHCEADTTCEEE